MATTLIPTTLFATTLAPTTIAADDVTIVCDPIVLTFVKPQGVLSHIPGPIDHDLDYLLDISDDPIVITLSQEGSISGMSSGDYSIPITIFIEGSLVVGTVISCNPIVITLEVSPVAEMILQSNVCNFVAWSQIGHLNFDITKTNEAGKIVMDWRGCVNEILKLGNSAVVYGGDGVAILTPSQNKYGKQTIHRIGLLNKEAVAGTEYEHYFIDKKYRLHRITQQNGLELLDYSEYLSLLTNPKLALDISEKLLYICDNVYGFVYGTQTKSFGEGPINITGVGYQGTTLYVTSVGTIRIPKFHVTTDMYDLGTRKPKTVQEIELGTDLTVGLEAKIESRLSNKLPFISSRWVLVNPTGRAFLPCYGIEFKFHVRSFMYEYFELDYLTIKGTMHEYEYLEAIGNSVRNDPIS